MSFTEGVQKLSEPVSKLINAVSGAIGKAYEPRYIRKMADARAYQIKRISDEIRNNADLPIVYNGQETSVDITNFDDLRKRAGSRLAYQEICKQENIESIIDKACIEIDGKTIESQENISKEWMNRFIDSAGEISTEEMQNYWARLLAGEVIKPNSFSLKTLDCLRNIQIKDANLFQKAVNIVLSDRLIYNDEEINSRYGVSYGDLLDLDDCGLINSSGMISLEMKVGKTPEVLLRCEDYVIIVSAETTQKLVIGEHPLTRAGRELLTIARDKHVDFKYFREVSLKIKSRNPNIKVTLHRILGKDEKT
ncbi:MAG: DUF2806 domain-containing protein, partial [Clostridia bacterium]|nr:DUF2806 domain-containing protein [Clostridia bacterium]